MRHAIQHDCFTTERLMLGEITLVRLECTFLGNRSAKILIPNIDVDGCGSRKTIPVT